MKEIFEIIITICAAISKIMNARNLVANDFVMFISEGLVKSVIARSATSVRSSKLLSLKKYDFADMRNCKNSFANTNQKQK